MGGGVILHPGPPDISFSSTHSLSTFTNRKIKTLAPVRWPSVTKIALCSDYWPFFDLEVGGLFYLCQNYAPFLFISWWFVSWQTMKMNEENTGLRFDLEFLFFFLMLPDAEYARDNRRFHISQWRKSEKGEGERFFSVITRKYEFLSDGHVKIFDHYRSLKHY